MLRAGAIRTHRKAQKTRALFRFAYQTGAAGIAQNGSQRAVPGVDGVAHSIAGGYQRQMAETGR